MPNNLFGFNPFSGIDLGIPLIKNEKDRRTGKVRSPYLAIGGGFIGIDYGYENPEFWGDALMSAELRQVELPGKAPFNVWAKQQSNKPPVYLFVDLNTMPANIKRLVTGEMVNAWSEVYFSTGVEAVLADSVMGRYLLKFSAENATADIWTRDGMIYRLQLQQGTIVQLALAPTEIAHKRIHQFKEQISSLNLQVERDMKRYHGILAGVVRLLRYVRDDKSRDMLVDFLVDQVGPNLGAGLRDDIRDILAEVRHPLASMFTSGLSAPNVVQLKTTTLDAAANRAAADKRKADLRRIRDAACQRAKGSTSGGGSKQQKCR